MVKTITEETYFQGSEAKSGILYSTVNQVNFLTEDGMIVVYNEIGVIEEVDDPEIGPTTEYNIMDNRPLKYTDQEMKDLLDSTGQLFNSGSPANLLISEMNQFINTIIINDITVNPNKYFNITVDKWEPVA